jgi:hypothetical protein
MSKDEIFKRVTEKVNPLIEKTKTIVDENYMMEEFSNSYWNRENLIKICNEIFNETYYLTNNAPSTTKGK